MPIRVPFSLIIAYVLAGVVIGMIIYHILAKLKISKANVTAEKIVEDANSKANNIIKEATLDAKTQAYEYKLEAEKEIKAQRSEVTRFENKLFRFKGFYISQRTLRIYDRPIAAQVLGYVGEVNDADLERDSYYRLGDYIGKSGLEKSYEEVLRG
ncbi:MAG: Rnase Y domain-containing protein, partial [bacterium]